MAINTNLLIAAPMLQDYFVDKTLGTPLAAGIVTFYRDDARTVLKNVYYLSGAPGAYSYVPFPNPMILSSVGTIQDPFGNDTIPYFYPFDEDNELIAQPYYVTVVSFDHIPQFTRQNFPQISSMDGGGTGQQTLVNLIPNGQFLAHNNLPNNNQVQNGVSQVVSQGSSSNTSVIIAQGGSIGWYFIKPATSTDTDIITFNQIEQEPQNLPGNPRYSLTLSCTAASGNDTFKYLVMRFNNVNHFSSNIQSYTFGFAGINNNSGSTNVNFDVIKYFGSGGSPATTTIIQSFSLINTNYQTFSTSFIFGANTNFTIGTNNDDYVELLIALPSTTSYSITLDNFMLTPGTINLADYPDEPDNIVFSTGVAGSMPTPDPFGNDLYLPFILTRSGVNFDTSQIGKVYATFSSTLAPGELRCDGAQYKVSSYSTDGIPYSRLFNVLYSGSANIPRFGCGSNFVNSYILNGATNNLVLITNQTGSAIATANGSLSTGFTISTNITGNNYSMKGHVVQDISGDDLVLAVGTVEGLVTAPNVQNSGFTITSIRNNANITQAFTISPNAASSITAGHYFTFSNTMVNYYVWFKINGSGSDPAPGGTGIEVDLLSTDTAVDVAFYIAAALSGYQVSRLQTIVGGSVPAGSYFTFNTSTPTPYYVWYSVSGMGTDPAPGGTGIKISILSSDTAAQVASKTMIALNSSYFAVPNLIGQFLRGTDSNGAVDPDYLLRFSNAFTVSGGLVGTFQLDNIGGHTHITDITGGQVGAPGGFIGFGNNQGPTESENFLSNPTGGSQTMPLNVYTNFVIKY